MEKPLMPQESDTNSAITEKRAVPMEQQTDDECNRVAEKITKELDEVEDLQTLQNSVIAQLFKDSSFQSDQLDSNNADVSFDLFNGFNEPFSTDHKDQGSKQLSEGPITIGSTEWCQGLAKDLNGRFIHVSFLFGFVILYECYETCIRLINSRLILCEILISP